MNIISISEFKVKVTNVKAENSINILFTKINEPFNVQSMWNVNILSVCFPKSDTSVILCPYSQDPSKFEDTFGPSEASGAVSKMRVISQALFSPSFYALIYVP